MQSYELTVVLPGKATEAKKKSTQKDLEKLIKDNKGKVGKLEDLGKIELAYKIKGSDSGNFLFYPLELNPETIGPINEKLRLKEEIIRYLLVKSDG
jgi:small subunit ribosomal protein S6